MKKRNRESISPPFPDKKETNHGTNGVELPGIKKSRLNVVVISSSEFQIMFYNFPQFAILCLTPELDLQQPEDLDGSPSRPITKDEEEVVETLYALADMFPNNNKNGLDGELGKPKSWHLPEGESSRPACEGSAAPEKEEDLKSLCLSTTSEAEAVNPSLLEGSSHDSVEVKCLKESSQPSFPNSTQLLTELDNTISQRNVQAISKLPKHEEAAACVRKPEIAVGKAAVVSSQHELHHTLKESSALWPGLSSAASNGDGTQRPSLKLSTPKIPAWLGMTASATQPGSLDNGVLTVKDSRALVARKKKSWKRCSAHVYICRLIKVLEIAEKTDRLPMQPTQLILNEGPNGVLSTPNSLNGVRTGLNGAVSAYNTVGSPAEKNPDEVRNVNLFHTRLLQDQQQASTLLPLNSPQKQCYDFLSLSAGGGGGRGCSGVGATNRIDQIGGGLDPLTQFHSPYMQSLEQNHTIMQFSLPQNRFSSTPFSDHLSLAASKQVQMQPPPYLGSSILGPPYLGNAASPKQQQQQRMWTAQLAAQYKPVGLAASHTPSWQNGKQDPSLAIHYVQSIPPHPSHHSLEVLGPRYAPISQQQLIGVTSSLPSSRYKGQYQVNGVGSYPDTALPLQLLCNEHF
ncbi:hypothetical protein TEA_027214 [Camellia sinensis var. sinensis]|uniref:Uncharacterized protein n=1 Tax=Camellia sinensis var. sinensis TaxID=542762 RepID=A0A4S4E7T0_CAMSN|nr:hypothetical protein TEA_027214 [Camellia sinensis var. sinensis]